MKNVITLSMVLMMAIAMTACNKAKETKTETMESAEAAGNEVVEGAEGVVEETVEGVEQAVTGTEEVVEETVEQGTGTMDSVVDPNNYDEVDADTTTAE